MGEDGIHVLHVDDDPSVTDLSATLLGEQGLRVTTETDPEAAVERFDPAEFDCVVSDYEMPRLDGLDLYRRLDPQFDHADFPYILFTGKGSESIAAEALNVGVTGYLQKGGPEQYERLANRIDNATTQYHAELRAERYETVIEALAYPVYVVDEEGRFRFVNEPFAEMAGYDRSEIIGESTSFVKPPETVEHAEDELGRLLSSEGPDVSRFGATIETADGSLVRCRDHMGVLPYEGEQFRGSVGILRVLDGAEARDTTPATDSTTERREPRFEALFDNIPDPAVIVDFESSAPVVRRVNDAFEETFGYESEALVGKSINDRLVPDDRLSEAREMDERSRSGESVSREVRRETADGERRDFLFRNVPSESDDATVACGIYTDITERTEYERKLAALHTTTRELLAADSADAVAEIGISAAQTVLDHDVTAVSFYDEGRNALEPAASTDRVRDLFGEIPTFEPGESAAWRAYETGERIVSDESDLFGAGTSVHSEMVLPLGDHGIWIVGSTERSAFGETERSLGRVLAANIEAALDQVERERALRESERAFKRENERLDEFASVVSHDLRNPLSLAQGHLDLAVQKYDGDADHLEKVSAAHDRMGALIEDVLTWAREGEMVESTGPVAVESLARECWEGFSGGDGELAVETDLTVLADRDRFRRLLENLFGNAVEHGGDDVTVRVGTLEGGDGLYVADDGPGVRPENRSDVFESGYTLSEDGNGFGLAIVDQIVEAHGWSISVTDSDSGGARFEITGVETA
jgi:PAS domain S-box-containing protein